MESREDLAKYFKELGFQVGAEVGVLGGSYSITLSEQGLKVYCIDTWGLGERRYRHYHERKYEEAKVRLAPYNCTLIRDYSSEAVRDFAKGSLDFVFIDAKHQFDYVMQDLIEWGKRVRAGGIMAGHDYQKIDVKEAVDIYIRMHNHDLHILQDNTWYFFLP